jgi:hypothetical protein
MKIVIQDKELNFNKYPDIFINGKTQTFEEWGATISCNGHDLDFEFTETLFLQKETSKVTIDWKIVEEYVKHIIANMQSIQTKGSLVLEELHRQIFGEGYLREHKGYFEMGGAKLETYNKIFTKPYFEYEIHFFLESEIQSSMDPYHSYKANFSNHNGLTLIGVSRIG